MTATVRILRGDIFTSQCRTLVNPVNCVGISGRGLALDFKTRFPLSFEAYADDCDDERRLCLGNPVDYAIIERGKRIVFFATKGHWRDKSRIGDVIEGITEMSGLVCENTQWYESIAIPALGCGLGGLRWEDVRPVIEHQAYVMKAHGVSVEIYEP